jgi:geranylgeranyl reductase family protein
MEPTRDVIVVGGGPAGSTVALLLAQQGHDVVLFDEARFPRDKICGEALSPGAWRMIESIGAAPALRQAGALPISGMCLTAPDGTSFRGAYDGGRTVGFALERTRLDAILLDRARQAGVEVRQGEKVSGLLRAGPSVTGVSVTANGEPHALQARVVIGADGRRSVVARSLGLLTESRRHRRFAVRGYWEGMQGLTSFGEMHVGAGGYCGIAPLAGGRANVTFVLDQRALSAAGRGLEGFYRDRLRMWPEIVERLAGAELAGPPRAIGPLALESSGVWAPGALLVGDAAGFFDPFTGEGIAAALRGAHLAAAVAHDSLTGRGDLSAYVPLHRHLVGNKFRFNRGLQWIVRRPALANLAARILSLSPAAADRLVGIAGDCVGADPASPVKARPARGRVRAGSRPPVV